MGPDSDVWCSARSDEVGEPLAGTAPVARVWLLLEQPGPWGRDAVRESHLPAGIAAQLAERAGASGVRLGLLRRPGAHPDSGADAPREVMLARTTPGTAWLRRWTVPDPGELLGLDLAAAAAGAEPEIGARVDEPVLLVCTNARRDRCCALRGRPVAAAVHATHPGRVWETSHLGGHRFAATAAVLPHGVVHGRLDAAAAGRLLDEVGAGRLPLDGYRGRSAFERPAQVAEAAVRASYGVDGIDELTASSTPAGEDAWQALVEHRDGRRWVALVGRRPGAPADPLRPESCGKPPLPVTALKALSLRAVR